MNNIQNSSAKLTQALQSGRSISMNSNGEWWIDGWFTRIVKWIFRLEQKSIINICNIVSKTFDTLEKSSVFFEADLNTTKHHQKIYQNNLAIAKAAAERLSKYRSKASQRLCFDLKRKIVGLSYRIEGVNGGLDTINKDLQNAKLNEKLFTTAAAWKKRQKLFVGKDAELYPLDKKHLEELCEYPEFVKILLEDRALQHEVFGWTLKNAVSPKAIIEFPATTKRLKQCYLVGRIGRYAYENVMSIDKTDILTDSETSAKQKILSLPFRGKKISILDETKYVEFRGDVIATIKDVFDDMKNKNNDAGSFEFIGKHGFRNWNTHKLGYWDAKAKVWRTTNLKADNWWKQLPVQEIITKEDVLRRYGIEAINDDQWVLLGRSARRSTEFRIDDCHGYCGILEPQGDGTWRVYDWGKYSKVWPQGCIAGIGMVGDTVKADYTYPDPNSTYSGFRQQALIPFVCSAEKGVEFMNERVRSNVIAGKEGNLVFMFGYENCAYAPQTDLEATLGKIEENGLVPNLFVTHVLSADAAEPLGFLFRNVAKAPKKMREFLVTCCDVMLLSSRGVSIINKDGKKEFKSLANSPFRTGCDIYVDGKKKRVKQHIYLPSQLHRRILNKEIPGVIFTGHQHMQLNIPN